jgi:hypothetical protein
MFHPVFNFADAYKRVAQDRLDHGRRLCIDDHAGDETEMFVCGQVGKAMFEGDRDDDKVISPLLPGTAIPPLPPFANHSPA